MARTSLIVKEYKKPKYKVRSVNRCPVRLGKKPCGRARGFMRKFGMCRICFRKFANEGMLPGIKKASW
ncbi:MAG: type Z 30S ribosomal protein S14 [Dehalococcoidia bacterium]|jgi:small subunit ribosomal protein S14|nr:MAG: small subunit ribosomal protein S14 [Chloroflexota bacterium]|tara:strand:+ start:1290 stop:1493 length:204 start_codon:yes stop_codon:yes gene_type:complete